MDLRSYTLLLALALSATHPACPAAAGAGAANSTAFEGSVEAARSGNDVFLTWKLPKGEFIRVEIYRNTNSSTSGRGRVNTTRTDVTQVLDQVPDPTVTYWYWIKVIRADGTHQNVGPVATPSGDVWQP